MRGGRPDRGTKTPARKCIQCDKPFFASKADHSCVRCPGCRNFRNGALPVTCSRCEIKLAINASTYYSRIKPMLDGNGEYLCSPCRHTLRARASKAKLAGREPVSETREILEAPCGSIWRTKYSQRCEMTWTQEGYCDHYWDCVESAIEHNWPGWRRVDDVPLRDSKRKWYSECAI